jgi:hypothetical protein
MNEFNYFPGNKRKRKTILYLFKDTTLIFALMIFLSFFQVYIFFQSFNIGVYSYVTPFELLLFFIPYFIVTPIIIALKIINFIISIICFNIRIYNLSIPIYIFIVLFVIIEKFFTNNKTVKFVFNNYVLYKEKFLSGKGIFKCFAKILNIVLGFYMSIITFSIAVLFCKLLSFSKTPSFDIGQLNDIDPISMFITTYGCYSPYFKYLFLVWALILMFWFYRYIKYYKRESFFRIKLKMILLTILILFVFETIKTTYKVDSLKSGKTIQKVEFNYRDMKIYTDSENIYIGQTKDYLFIRNIKREENKVYNISDIKNLIVTDPDSFLIEKNELQRH